MGYTFIVFFSVLLVTSMNIIWKIVFDSTENTNIWVWRCFIFVDELLNTEAMDSPCCAVIAWKCKNRCRSLNYFLNDK